jgi:hypothetical protein
MSSNNRILYSAQVPSIVGMGYEDIAHSGMVHGVQSVGINSNFNLEQAYELGQIEIFENIEGTPEIEVTLEKVIDGYPLIYLLASTGVTDTSASGLVARSKARCDFRLGIFGEEFNNVASATDNSGGAEVEVYCSGMYIGSVSYSLPVDGNATESVTLAGNNKEWLTGSNVMINGTAADPFDGSDTPFANGVVGAPSGGIQRREDVMIKHSILPQGIYGVNGTGVGNGFNNTTKENRVHLQSMSISTDFSREDVSELGKKTPYYRPAGFPIEVSCEIEAISTSGDFIAAFEEGDPSLHGTIASGNNTGEEIIYVVLRGGIVFDLGAKNRLSSVSYGGGDATGGNVTNSFSYSNFNDLDVKQIGHNNTGVMGYNNTSTNVFGT